MGGGIQRLHVESQAARVGSSGLKDLTVISDGAAGLSATLSAVHGSDMIRNSGGARG